MQEISHHLRAAIRLLRQRPESSSMVSVFELALQMTETEAGFGELLRQRRDAAGLSVVRLAKRAGLCEGTIKNLEAARTTPALETIVRLLAVPELRLATSDHDPPPQTARELRPNSYLTARYDPAGMAQDLRAIVNGPGGTIEQSHLYLDSQSAADYLAVCEAYGGVRGKLLATLDEVAGRIAADSLPVDLVAIGSGDGRAEVALAHALAQRGCLHRLYLLDISHVLLTKAHEHAAAVLHPHGVEVEAVHGNFHELQRYPMIHGGAGKAPRLYTLLGATIANLSDELRFFRDLASCATPGDLAVLDYQLAHDDPTQDPTLRAGTVPKILYDWHAGPLRRNNPNVREVRMELHLGPGRIPGGYVVVCSATATLADGSTRLYRVGGSSRYRTDLLSAALAGAGWATVSAEAYDQRTAVMLLRRV